MNRLVLRFLLAGLAAAGAAGCNSGNPVSPVTDPPRISCPAPITVTSTSGQPIAVTLTKPSVTGGAFPIETTCSQRNGATFPMGSTTVTCQVRDAQGRSASCGFPVTVQAPSAAPRLAVSRFVSFGDSITEGVLFTNCSAFTLMPFRESLRYLPRAINSPWNYPNVLQNQLRARYTTTPPTVTNRGLGGEWVSERTTTTRLATVLSTDLPEVLLLQEGANDVVQQVAPSMVASGLRDLVRLAAGRGVPVILGTLVPQKASSCRSYLNPPSVPPVNEAIRAMAASEGVPLVDLYAAFGSAPGDLISVDGLHPSEAGYQQIAASFLDIIRQRYER